MKIFAISLAFQTENQYSYLNCYSAIHAEGGSVDIARLFRTKKKAGGGHILRFPQPANGNFLNKGILKSPPAYFLKCGFE